MVTFLRLFLFISVFAGFLSCKTLQRNSVKPDKQATELEQTESSALLIEGTRHKIKGNVNRAVGHYIEAARKDPSNSAAYYELAKVYAMDNQYKEALKYAVIAQELDPENIYFNILLADIYAINDQYDKAIEIEKELLKKHPQHSPLYFSHIETLFHVGRYEEAIEILNEMERNTGFSEEIAIERQNLYLHLDRIDLAINEVEQLVKIYPNSVQYMDYLANLYLSAEMKDEAFALYEEMLRRDPENPYPLLLLADYYQMRGEKKEAFDYVLRAFENPYLEMESKERIMFSFFSLSAKDSIYMKQSYVLCELFVEQHPDKAEPYLIYGDFVFRDEQYEEARELYLKAANIAPGKLELWQQVLYIDNQLHDYESMFNNSSKALEYFFEYPLLFYYRAISAYNLEDYSTVVNAMQQAIALMPQEDIELLSDFYTLKADAYNSLKNFEKADKSYEQAINKNPENAFALNNYSYNLSIRKKNLEKAENMSKLSNKLMPDMPSFQDTYGWIMYQMGNYKEARKWIEKAMDNMTEERPVIIEHYGDVLYKLGEKDKALYFWKKADEAGDGSEFLQMKITDETLYE